MNATRAKCESAMVAYRIESISGKVAAPEYRNIPLGSSEIPKLVENHPYRKLREKI
jgi:hypothetical protein